MIALRGRIAWLLLIVVVAIVELAWFPRDPIAVVLAGVALLACGWVLPTLVGRASVATEAPATASMPAPPPPIPPVTRSTPAAIRTRETKPFPAAESFEHTEPPFISASRAHQLPWLLPAHPSAPGVAADEATVGALAVRAASVVGAGHRCVDPTPRQDAYLLGRDAASRYLVVAVADGVGSAKHSDIGATIAVQSMVGATVAALNAGYEPEDLGVGAIFAGAAEQLGAEAARRGVAADDLACVIVLAVVDSATASNGGHTAWVHWLGDVSVWERAADGWRHLLGDAKTDASGMETNEVTASLPAEPDRVTGATITVHGAVAFVTDGIGDPLRNHPDVNRYLTDRWQTAPPVAAFVNDVLFEVRGEQDDRTAVVVWAAE